KREADHTKLKEDTTKLKNKNTELEAEDISSCDIKTVSQGNDRGNIESSVDIASQISNQQKTIPNTPLLAEDLDDSDKIELTKNQNIELDLIRDLRSGSTIASPTEDNIYSKLGVITRVSSLLRRRFGR
ncbi:15182_t:CDS:2, partial [Dentiscutata erythropus]